MMAQGYNVLEFTAPPSLRREPEGLTPIHMDQLLLNLTSTLDIPLSA
jgi:hypothetical protein